MIFEIVKLFGGGVIDYFKDRAEEKKIERKGRIEIKKAEIEAGIKLAAEGQKADIQLANKSVENAGWKDEYWTFVLSIPTIMAFIPDAAQYVLDGFKVLSQTPEWYQYILIAVILSPFGYRIGRGSLNAITSIRKKQPEQKETKTNS